jgi:hypothetical protein
MTLIDDLDAISADATLTADERYHRKANLKAYALRDAVRTLGPFPATFNFARSGHAFVVTVLSVKADQGVVWVQLSATRDGVTLWFNAPARTSTPTIGLANPPILTVQVGGNIVRNGREFVFNLVGLAKLLYAELVAVHGR